jgi:hypothetical protein
VEVACLKMYRTKLIIGTAAMAKKKVGRPKSSGETAKIRKEIKFTPSDSRRLEEYAFRKGTPVATFIKRAIDAALHRDIIESDVFSIPFIQAQQTGEFEEIIRGAERVNMGTFGELIGVQSGDFLVRAIGEDLESADPAKHVPDGAILLMRPYRFTVGDICFVRVLGNNGTVRYTIKKLSINPKTSAIQLLNGSDEIVHLDNVEDIYPIAVERARIDDHFDLEKLYHKELGRLFMWCQNNGVDDHNVKPEDVEQYYREVNADGIVRLMLDRFLRSRQEADSKIGRKVSLKNPAGNPKAADTDIFILKKEHTEKIK